MKLLTIFVAVLVLKFADFRGLVHQDRWYEGYRKRWLSADEHSPSRQLILAILLPAILITMVVCLVEGWLFGIIGFGLNILILLYCFGRGDLPQQVSSYLEKFKNKDNEGAYNMAMLAELLQEDLRIENASDLNREMLSGLVYQEFLRFYLVFFWYLILGVFGALFICFSMLFQRVSPEAKKPEHLINRFMVAAEWIPARILAFTFGLVGNFESVYQAYKQCDSEYELGDETIPAQLLLNRCGLAALGLSDDDMASEVLSDPDSAGGAYIQLVERVEDVQRLLFRSLVIWLAGLSILTIAGLLS